MSLQVLHPFQDYKKTVSLTRLSELKLYEKLIERMSAIAAFARHNRDRGFCATQSRSRLLRDTKRGDRESRATTNGAKAQC